MGIPLGCTHEPCGVVRKGVEETEVDIEGGYIAKKEGRELREGKDSRSPSKTGCVGTERQFNGNNDVLHHRRNSI